VNLNLFPVLLVLGRLSGHMWLNVSALAVSVVAAVVIPAAMPTIVVVPDDH